MGEVVPDPGPAAICRLSGDTCEPWADAQGVVVIHDAVGMTPDLRAQAEWLAGAGYLARRRHRIFLLGAASSAVSSLPWTSPRAAMPSSTSTPPGPSATRPAPGCTGLIGVIGFCMGGGFAVVLAAGHGFEASGVNYEALPETPRTCWERLPDGGQLRRP